MQQVVMVSILCCSLAMFDLVSSTPSPPSLLRMTKAELVTERGVWLFAAVLLGTKENGDLSVRCSASVIIADTLLTARARHGSLMALLA